MLNKVLLVDDEVSILRALERLLIRSGYRVFTAANGMEALARLQQDSCQVVISDFRMPQMSGAELLAQVKQLYPESVCMVLSGYSDFQSVLQLLNSGTAFRFLQKPWEDAQLLAELHAAFVFYRHNRNQAIRSQLLISGRGALLELAADGRVSRSNGAAQQLLGQPEGALTGTPFGQWFRFAAGQQAAFLQDIHGSLEVCDSDGAPCELHVQYQDDEYSLVGCARLQPEDGPAVMSSPALLDQHAVLVQLDALLLQRRPFAVAALRLKNFSDWADMVGYAEAGQMFDRLSERLAVACRPYGALAYLANELFILTLPAAATEVQVHQQLTALLQQLRQQLEEQILALRPQLTVSYCMAPEDGDSAKVLLSNVLTCNRIHLHSPHTFFMRFSAAVADKKRQQLRISDALFRAVEEQQFELYFQAKLDLHQQRADSCEVLLRWRHPEFGMVSPALFIPIAEHDGQIIEIGLWVLRQACMVLTRWQQDQVPLHRMAVNISGVQLQQADFIPQVQRILAETGADPQLLELELTESWMMQDLEQSASALSDLKALGLRIAIDDFGTGYSSLAYLSRLPVDVLKIDRSLISDLESNINTQSLISNICRMAHALHVEVVVEGVENAEQLQLLARMGCDMAQGYLIARPVPAEEFLQQLQAGEYDNAS